MRLCLYRDVTTLGTFESTPRISVRQVHVYEKSAVIPLSFGLSVPLLRL